MPINVGSSHQMAPGASVLTRLCLTNVCQFERLDVPIGPGLTVIVGRQGAGKSNLCVMGLSSITGDNPLFGTKELNIRRGAENEKSEILTEWQRHGKRYTVSRVLQKGKSTFAVDGVVDKTIRRESEVTVSILKALGIEKSAVMGFSMVEQSKTANLLNTLPTDRIRFMAELVSQTWVLNLEAKAKSAVDMLQQRIGFDYQTAFSNAVLTYNQQQANLSSYQANLEQLLPQLAASQAKVAEFADLAGQVRQLADLKSRLQAKRQQQYASEHQLSLLNAALTELHKQQAKSQDLQHRVAMAVYIQAARDKGRNDQQLQVDRAGLAQWQETRVAVAAWYKVVLDATRRGELVRQITQTNSTIAILDGSLVAPPEPAVERVDPQAIVDIQGAIAAAERRLKLVQEGKSECDKCGAPVQILPGEETGLFMQLKDLRSAFSDMISRRDAWHNYKLARDRYDRELPGLTAQRKQCEDLLATVQQELDQIPPAREIPAWVSDPNYSLTAVDQAVSNLSLMIGAGEARSVSLANELQRALLDCATIPTEVSNAFVNSLGEQDIPQALRVPGGVAGVVAARQAAEVAIATKEANRQSLEQTLVAIRTEVEDLQRQIDQLAPQVGGDRQRQLNEATAWVDKLTQDKSTYEVMIAAEQVKLEQSREQVTKLTEQLREQQVVTRAKDLLEGVYNEVRLKDLPRELLVMLMQGFGKQMSALCYELGQPFEITVSNELEFIVRHANGQTEPAQRLSGGQQACVATVFWLVRLLSNAANSLPLLILDEPSANMDAQAIARFGEMLQKLGPILVQRGLQVILVTHHMQLQGCGQQVINLGA